MEYLAETAIKAGLDPLRIVHYTPRQCHAYIEGRQQVNHDAWRRTVYALSPYLPKGKGVDDIVPPFETLGMSEKQVARWHMERRLKKAAERNKRFRVQEWKQKQRGR